MIFIKNAGPAVSPKAAFTLIEVLTVVIIIGILATLAYSSLMELIFTNRAKDTAQTMRVFVERALTEGKRLNKPVTIELDGNIIRASVKGNDTPFASESLGGFSGESKKIDSENRIGLSGIEEGHFEACNTAGYCSMAVKFKEANFFKAQIKRKNSTDWETL